MTEAASAAMDDPPPLRGLRLALSVVWVVGVTTLHLAVRLFGLAVVP